MEEVQSRSVHQHESSSRPSLSSVVEQSSTSVDGVPNGTGHNSCLQDCHVVRVPVLSDTNYDDLSDKVQSNRGSKLMLSKIMVCFRQRERVMSAVVHRMASPQCFCSHCCWIEQVLRLLHRYLRCLTKVQRRVCPVYAQWKAILKQASLVTHGKLHISNE